MKTAARWGYALIWPLFVFAAFESIVRGSVAAFLLWAAHAPFLTLAINYLLFFMLFGMFYRIKRRNWFILSQFAVTVMLALIAGVSRTKMTLRMEPFLPADILLIKDALHIGRAYIPSFYLLLGLCGAGFLLLLVFILFRFKKGRRGDGFSFSATIAGILFLLSALYVFSGPSQSFRGAVRAAAWQDSYSVLQNARKNGSAFQFLDFFADHRSAAIPPDGYSDAAIIQLAKEQPAPIKASEIKPNIILLLGESIVDLSLLDGLSLTGDPLPNLRRLMDENPSGTLTVGSFGGGTYMAETAMLTGLVIDAYRSHKADSIPHRLKPLGYESTAIHTYWGWFYDRHKDLKDLGFDLFLPLETLHSLPAFTPYPTDAPLYNQLLKRLKDTAARDFIYAATMEAHGGYDFDAIYETAMNLTPLPLDAEKELNNYLTLAARADKALGELIGSLEAYPEPTVLIYFGDHYPSIPKTLAALHLSLEHPALYETPYFVWANFPLDLPDNQSLDADRLTATVLDALGLPLTLAQSLRDEDALAIVKYDTVYGKRLAAQTIGIDFENPTYQIGFIPEVDNAILDSDGTLILKGKNLAWRTILKTQTTYDLLLFETDGQTTRVRLPEGFPFDALNDGGTLLFVDDHETPFAACDFPAPLFNP